MRALIRACACMVQESKPHPHVHKPSSPAVLFRSLQHGELKAHMHDPKLAQSQPVHRAHRTVGFELSPHAELFQPPGRDISSHAVSVASDDDSIGSHDNHASPRYMRWLSD